MMKFNVSKITNQVINFAKKAVKPIIAKMPDKGAKLNEALAKSNSASQSAGAVKALGAVLIAHETDEVIQKVPFIKEVYDWWVSTVDSLYGKTVYKIPGFGKVAKQISDFAGRLIIPNAQKAIEKKREEHLNNPAWYTNLDMHTEFKIPFVYGDNVPLNFGTEIDTAAICVMTLGYNPMADRFSIESRLNQALSLMKAVRGLSGRLPYGRGDLFYYDLITKYVINEYYKLKFSIRLSNLYIMTKTRMPRNVMTEMGWDFDDFLQNKALYVSMLTNLANFIRNDLPLFGKQIEKIKSFWDCMIPDCNDGKVALYYKMYPVIDGYIPSVSNNVALYERFGDKFFDYTPDKSANDQFGQSGKTYNMTYAQYSANMLSFMNKLNNNLIFNPIKADIIGAFGQSAIWNDADIKKCEDPNGLLGKFDELYLTMIQNATILDEHPAHEASGTLSTAIPNDLFFSLQFGGVSADGGVESPYLNQPNADNATINVVYEAQNTSGLAGQFFFGGTDGRKAGYISDTDNTCYYTEDLTILSNKYNTSEGEDLEITQLLAKCVDQSKVSYDGTSTDSCRQGFITNCFFVTNADILYCRSGADYKERLGHTVIPLENSGAAIAAYTAMAREIQFWSQSDYMTKVHISAFILADRRVIDNLMLDYNIMGSISTNAFRQAIKYSTYSVYSADIKVTETRKASNIVDVYNARV